MKKGVLFFAAMIMALGLAACDNNVKDVVIDYGSSDIYEKSDMDEAIELIKKEFATWEGCELHSISYTSDESNNEENIAWLNRLEGKTPAFTQCMQFVSSFHSPKAETGGPWTPDKEYTKWQWWLARSDGGKWTLVTWGY